MYGWKHKPKKPDVSNYTPAVMRYLLVCEHDLARPVGLTEGELKQATAWISYRFALSQWRAGLKHRSDGIRTALARSTCSGGDFAGEQPAWSEEGGGGLEPVPDPGLRRIVLVREDVAE